MNNFSLETSAQEHTYTFCNGAIGNSQTDDDADEDGGGGGDDDDDDW